MGRSKASTAVPIIQARHLSFSYPGGPRILDDLTFSVARGSFVTFIGPSGSGKTTLLHILGRMYRRFEGELEINSEHLSFVFQDDSLLEWKNALQNVLLPFEIGGFPAGARDRGRRMLELVGLGGYESYYPGELSGGMKKRVELARALVTEPDLLILDEPFSSLDLLTRERLNVLLRTIHRRTQSSVVLVTHSVEEACYLSNEIMVLSSVPARIVAVEEIDRQQEETVTTDGCAEPAEVGTTSGGTAVVSGNGSGTSAPASETPKHGDTEEEEVFVLSEAEYRANRDLRNTARSLWRQAPQEQAVRTTGDGRQTAATEGGDGRRTRPLRGPAPRSVWRNLAIFLSELAVGYLLLATLKGVLPIPDLLLPHPADIVSRFVGTLGNATVMRDIRVTVTESLSGFAIAFVLTMVLGYGIAKSKYLSRLLMPGLIVANTIPSVALAPFLVLWFGFGLAPKIVTSVIVIFFPMLINNIAAIRFADDRLANLKRFYDPGRLKAFTLFELPAALPMVFSGVKVSITLSVIGAVVGEFVSGSEGLGALVSRAKAGFDIELMFSGLIWLAILGLTYYGTASLVYWLVTRNRPVNETK
jgi:ABC-type nitrate/sulfonate/bicarbonate transport system ATPase subunit/ABC-type nitrate/sulfonate/bicarbonate transport system permease component